MGVSDLGTAQQEQSTGQGPFPLNRVVAFLGPFLAIVSGALATWLINNFPGLHIDKATLASNITAAIVFLVGAGGTFAMQHKWLTGWQAWEHSVTEAATLPTPDLMPGGEYDPSEFDAAPLGPSDESAEAPPGGDAAGVQTPADEPPLVDPGPSEPTDQSGELLVLPDALQESGSVPQTGSGPAASPVPETGVQPDAPVDEIQPDNGGDAGEPPDAEQELQNVPEAIEGAVASPVPETAVKPDVPIDEIEPAGI